MARPERALDLWIGASLAADRTTDVVVTWTARPQANAAELTRGTIAIVAQGAGEKQTFEAPLDAHQLAFKVAPGALQIHATVRDSQGQTADEDMRQVDVPDFVRAKLALSSPAVLRARNPMELRSLRADKATTPFAGREFTRTDRLFIRFSVYGEAARQADVSARLLSRGGGALLALPVTGPAAAGAPYEIDLPLASVARGDYLIEVAARAGDDHTETLIPLRIVS